MNIIRLGIHRPVGVTVGVLLVMLFGLLALYRIPVQLTPDVRKPTMTVRTLWAGAAPLEVEAELTIPMEDLLKAVPGLEKISSSSYQNRSEITLEFEVDTDMDSALVLVSNRLQQMKEFPAEAQRPVLKTAGSEDQPITYMILRRLDKGDQRPLDHLLEFAEEVIQTPLERVPGVALVNVNGGRQRELRVTVDPVKMAARRITLADLAALLKRENADISAGQMDEGKRSYAVRTLGRLSDPRAALEVVVKSGEFGAVTLGEIATVSFELATPTVNVRGNGRPGISVNAVQEQGANVLSIMAEVRSLVEHLNREELNRRGLELLITYDQTDYILAALDLVRQNLVVGGVLAMGILLFLLRSASATTIIAVAIPISVVGAFAAMAALGRSVNVVSLAGLAFAVGMVVDPAIVVLENVVRHRSLGYSREEAAVRGTTQVYGAILISTLTTVAVFLPILGLKLEAAQLFGDIAVALSAAVLISLVVAGTVIPTMAARLGRREASLEARLKRDHPLIRTIAAWAAGLVERVRGRPWAQITLAGGVMGSMLAITVLLLPPAEYLPTGNRNLVFAMLVPPPGYNLDEMTRMAGIAEQKLLPHLKENKPPGDDSPALRFFFFVARGAVAFMGGVADDPDRVRELLPVIKDAVRAFPATIGIVNQSSLFSRATARGRALDLTISGQDLEKVITLTRRLYGMAQESLPGAQIRPVPGLELGNPELRLRPNRLRAAENGLSTVAVGQAIDAFTDGLKVDEVLVDNQELDLVVRGSASRLAHVQEVGQLPLVTPRGDIIPVATVAELEYASGPIQVNHYERERAVSLSIQPPADMALETAADLIQQRLIDPVVREGLPSGVNLHLTEGADQLVLAKEAMLDQFLLAFLITYLLMAALFESFLFPLVVIVTVPLATAGGVLGLQLLNLITFQPMDILAMLGFVILIGVIVNNAVLLVHQANNFMAEGMGVEDAVRESVRIRVRPIFLSTFTSVAGMLPLVISPGAGSELYRGLGVVVGGGLLVGTVLTLVLVPTLFVLTMALKTRIWGVGGEG